MGSGASVVGFDPDNPYIHPAVSADGLCGGPPVLQIVQGAAAGVRGAPASPCRGAFSWSDGQVGNQKRFSNLLEQ